MSNSREITPNEPDSGSPEDLDRRETLARLGRFAAYTSPAMLVLLTSKKATAASGPDDGGP